MSSERWRLVERLYHDALERPAAERPAFLAEACAGDEALGSDVQSLLDQPSMPGFLEEPALAVAAALAAAVAETPEPPWVGRHIGVYHLQSLLGAAAWARSTARATRGSAATSRIKILPRGVHRAIPSGSRASSARRALLASLNHPHIGAIYGFEEADGVRGARPGARRRARRSPIASPRGPAADRRGARRSRDRSPTRSTRRTTRASSIAI